MKAFKKIIILTCILLGVNSCIGLEEDTSSVLLLENLATPEDVTAAITPMYKLLVDAYRNPNDQRTASYGGDDITTWAAGNKAPFRVFDRFDYGNGENSTGFRLEYGWERYWKIIYIANTVLRGLDSESDESFVKIAEGEARLMRALVYFHLVRIHGNMPIILEKTIPTGEEQRATVLENYKHIENDLLIAETLLPGPNEVQIGRLSSAMAKSVLADLYLTWGGWPVKDQSKYQLAANKAKEVIDMDVFTLLSIDELWLLENQNSSESIFALQVSEAEGYWSYYPTAFSFHEARGFSDIIPELQFFFDFPEGPRKDATFQVDIPQRGVQNGVIVSLDPPTVPWQESQRKHPMYKKFTISENLSVSDRTRGFRAIEVYRYAEVLLIHAEAQARVGATASSLESLNQVKRRAAGFPYNMAGSPADAASATPNAIVDERGWELAGEFRRFFDLVRTERLQEIAARRDPSEPVGLLRQPTEANYIAPIPFVAISTSKLVQNPIGFKIR
jgi:hypothetical protein